MRMVKAPIQVSILKTGSKAPGIGLTNKPRVLCPGYFLCAPNGERLRWKTIKRKVPASLRTPGVQKPPLPVWCGEFLCLLKLEGVKKCCFLTP